MIKMEYGIKTGTKSEKEIIKAVNAVLQEEITNAPDNKYTSNKMEKKKTKGGWYSPDKELKDSDLFDFTYNYHNKYWALSIQLYANMCKKGLIFEDECITWVLFVYNCVGGEIILSDSNDPSLSRTNRLINKIIEALPFEGVFLKGYDEENEPRVLEKFN